jgi:plastocyanin
MLRLRRSKSFLLLSGVVLAAGLASCGDSDGRSGQPGTVPELTIRISAQGYTPDPALVSAGTRVTWVNDDSVAHTATSTSGAFDTGQIQPGDRASINANTAGTFEYFCTNHPNMRGTLQVGTVQPSPTPSATVQPTPSPTPTDDPYPNLPTCSGGMSCGGSCSNEGYHCHVGNVIRNCFQGTVYCSGS